MSDNSPSENSVPPRGGCRRIVLIGLLFISCGLNFLLCATLSFFRSGGKDEDLTERVLFRKDGGKNDKIAVIHIDGVLMEGMIHYDLKQIEMAAKDEAVRAIVLRVDSPGGTISASEELFKQLKRLRDGNLRRYPESKPKKLVVSMGPIAASGGYYVSMPGEKLYAERGTLTGSIGVYASLPNVSDFIHEHGIKFELIKAGGIKASGSPFHPLTPQERQPWQDIVDASYDQFLDVVVEGRPKLTKEALKSTPLFRKEEVLRDEKGNAISDWWGRPRKTHYTRYLADGGSFTSAQAKQYGLIDEIGDLEDAIDAVASLAQLSKYTVVEYDRPVTLWNSVLGVRQDAHHNLIDPQQLSKGLNPRMWYLAPQADLAGILAGMEGAER